MNLLGGEETSTDGTPLDQLQECVQNYIHSTPGNIAKVTERLAEILSAHTNKPHVIIAALSRLPKNTGTSINWGHNKLGIHLQGSGVISEEDRALLAEVFTMKKVGPF